MKQELSTQLLRTLSSSSQSTHAIIVKLIGIELQVVLPVRIVFDVRFKVIAHGNNVVALDIIHLQKRCSAVIKACGIFVRLAEVENIKL